MYEVSPDKTSHSAALNCRMDLDRRAHCSSDPSSLGPVYVLPKQDFISKV